MPRFLIETDAVPPSLVEAATRLAALRFPEISVDESSTHGDPGSGSTLWVCGAPSRNHLERWANALRLRHCLVRRIESDQVFHPNAHEELR